MDAINSAKHLCRRVLLLRRSMRLSRFASNYTKTIVVLCVLLYTVTRPVIYSSINNGRRWIFGNNGYDLSEPTQFEIDYIASHMTISVTRETIQTSESASIDVLKVTFQNDGTEDIYAAKWQIYTNFMRPPARREIFNLSNEEAGCRLNLSHVNGYLFKFEPVSGRFTKLRSSEQFSCTLLFQYITLTRSTVFPRWYVSAENKTATIVKSTDDDALTFVHFQSYCLNSMCDTPGIVYSPEDRYKQYHLGFQEVNPKISVIPTPLHLRYRQGEMEFVPSEWVIVSFNKEFEDTTKRFAKQHGLIVISKRPPNKFILITKSSLLSIVNPQNGQMMNETESYVISTRPDKQCIHIHASSKVGLFYALQTLNSLLFVRNVDDETNKASVKLPGFIIKDSPRYSYRGLSLDVARHFIKPSSLYKIMDILAMFKMNKLHLHLSDNEGWRLEIPGIPELTEVGSVQCHDLGEDKCIVPSHGSGPNGYTSGSGFYTVNEYKGILKYAEERHIQIIPEIDMPGHSHAAIKAIQSKASRASQNENPEDLYSVFDKSGIHNEYTGSFKEEVLNPCLSSTFKFIEKIVMEVKRMHQTIQPLKVFHFGGDEVDVGTWVHSNACKLVADSTPNKHTEMFIKRIAEIAYRENVSVALWEDGALYKDSAKWEWYPFSRDVFKSKDVYVNVWNWPDFKKFPHRAKLFANMDYKVILAYAPYLYFDHPYEPDFEERGLKWAAAKVSTKDVWSFTPDLMFSDGSQDCPQNISDRFCYDLLKPANIIGLQASLFTETVHTEEHLEYMLFPRLLAVAEKAWHQSCWDNNGTNFTQRKWIDEWSEFIHDVGHKELFRLDKAGIKYRVPPPGAILENGRLKFNTEFPGLVVEYFNDSLDKWEPASEGMPVKHKLQLRTRSADGKRLSKIVEVYKMKRRTFE